MPDGLTRRDALAAIGAMAAGAALGSQASATPSTGPASRAAGVTAEVLETKVISWQDEHYHGWPTIARCRSGRLVLVYSGGRETHVCPFGRVEMMHSDDDGKTWTWPRVLLDSAIDDRDAGVLHTARGTLLVTTFSSLAYSEGRSEDRLQKDPRWQAVHNRLSPEQRKADLNQWMLRSTDGGVTWSARYAVPVNSPHGPIQLSDGRLLYAGQRLWKAEEPRLLKRSAIYESRDDGFTWQHLAEIPNRERDNPREYHELYAVEAADGRIVVHIRNHNKPNSGETLQCESADGGKTWTVPAPIGVWGLPSHLLRLKDDALLMTYGHRRGPFGVQARLSRDHGRTWSDALMLTGDGTSGDLGYPSTVQLADGSLLTVWYETIAGSPKAVLRQARWTLA
jgi:Neuraminidase (sialidase)